MDFSITNINFKALKLRNEPNAIAEAGLVINGLFSITGIKIYETGRNRQGLYVRYPNNFNISSTRARIAFDERILEKFDNYPLFVDSETEDNRLRQLIFEVLKRAVDSSNN